jgi:hypothetical protein
MTGPAFPFPTPLDLPPATVDRLLDWRALLMDMAAGDTFGRVAFYMGEWIGLHDAGSRLKRSVMEPPADWCGTAACAAGAALIAGVFAVPPPDVGTVIDAAAEDYFPYCGFDPIVLSRDYKQLEWAHDLATLGLAGLPQPAWAWITGVTPYLSMDPRTPGDDLSPTSIIRPEHVALHVEDVLRAAGIDDDRLSEPRPAAARWRGVHYPFDVHGDPLVPRGGAA